jgi:hypothetical protein
MAMMELSESRASRMDLEGMTKLLIEDESLPTDLLTESPEIIMHRILNDNSLLTERQKQFI